MALNQDELNKFRIQRERLGGMLSEASDVINKLNMTSASENLGKLSKKVNNDTFKIQVIGTFSNGKSSVINALLGENVLPAYALPTTAVINEIKYGEKKKATLYFRNPLPDKLPNSLSAKAMEHMKKHNMQNVPPMAIQYKEIEDYVVIPIGTDAEEMLFESPYEKVELFWPLPMLKEGVEIIDSPGLNESTTRTRVTMDYLSKSDAILFVLAADRLCSQEEMDFIENNLNAYGFTDPFFIVNRFDLINDREKDRVKTFAKMRLSEYSTNEIFYISAQQALKGEMSNDALLYQESGMSIFTKNLAEFLTKDKGRVKLTQPARELKRILNTEALYKIIPGQRKMLDSTLDEVKARYEKAKPQLATLNNKKAQIVAKLMLRIEQSKPELRRAVKDSTLSIVQKIPSWLEEYTPENKPTTKKNIKKVTKEITTHIANKISEHQKKWNEEVLIPLINEKTNFIFDESEPELKRLYSELDTVSMKLINSEESTSVIAPLRERIMGAAGGISIEYKDVLFAGGFSGIMKDSLKGAGLILGTHAVLTLFTVSNPILLAGLIISLIGTSEIRMSSIIKDVKKKLGTSFVDAISSKTDENADKIVEPIILKLTEITDKISTSIDGEIKQTEDLVNGIIEEMNKGKASIDARKQIISSCEIKLKALSSELDAFTFELIEQK